MFLASEEEPPKSLSLRLSVVAAYMWKSCYAKLPSLSSKKMVEKLLAMHQLSSKLASFFHAFLIVPPFWSWAIKVENLGESWRICTWQKNRYKLQTKKSEPLKTSLNSQNWNLHLGEIGVFFQYRDGLQVAPIWPGRSNHWTNRIISLQNRHILSSELLFHHLRFPQRKKAGKLSTTPKMILSKSP